MKKYKYDFKFKLIFLIICIIAFFPTENAFAAELSGTHSSGTKTYTIGNAGTYGGVAEEGFTISGGTVNLQATSPFFTFRGPIIVTGGTLNIKFSSSYSGSGSILKREVENLRNSSGYIPAGATSGSIVQYSGALFIVSGGTLNIEGNSETNRISLSGAGQFTADYQNGICTFPATYDTSDDVESTGPLINVSGTGTVNLKYVHLNSNYNNTNSGGAIYVGGTKPKVTIDGCHINKCYTSLQGSALAISTSEGGSVVMNNTTIQECYTAAVKETTGGTIRCVGMSMCTLEMNNCIIKNNYSRLSSGGISWNAMRIAPLIINNCTIENNVSMEGSGGISCQSLMNITGATKIINNRSINGNGGGIIVSTWGSTTPAIGFELTQDGNIVLGPDVVISGNKAGGNGGGIHFKVRLITTNNGATNSSDIVEYPTKSDGTPYNMKLIINGATIENNEATGDGGAIYMLKESNTSYIMKLEMNSGTISGNKTSSNGAAAYLLGDGADFVFNGGTITDHTSAINGGAVYTSGGSFKMTGGVLENNIASQNGNVYVSSGNFEMSGGEILNNSSKNGGAVFVSGGNANLSGGTIMNSNAENGGAVCIENGNFYMDGGIIKNNYASSNGGGIYASSNSKDLNVEILSGSIIGNIAALNGGGIGINMEGKYVGNITIGLESCLGLDDLHSHPIIQNNTANQNGGGIWLEGDNMTMNMYCGFINENIALYEPGSSNIYQTGGLATVYSGTVGEGVIVIGGEYVYVPENQIPEVYITYNSNITGNIEEKTALVTVGVEIYLPKNLYTRDDYVLIGWSYVPDPTELDTIFEAGAPYMVTDKDVTVYAVWRIRGLGNVIDPVITSGKKYNDITGGTNIMIAANAAVTTQMIVENIDSDLYPERTLSFDKYLPNGTTILMVDKSNPEARMFYNYKVINNTTNRVNLSDFIKMGTNEKYSVLTVNDEGVLEDYLFIIEFPLNNTLNGATQIKFTRKSNNLEMAPIEQIVSYTTTDKRIFNLDVDDTSLNITDEFKVEYSFIKPNNVDTRFINKNINLIIGASDGNYIPPDTILSDGTNEYQLDANGKFLIKLRKNCR